MKHHCRQKNVLFNATLIAGALVLCSGFVQSQTKLQQARASESANRVPSEGSGNEGSLKERETVPAKNVSPQVSMATEESVSGSPGTTTNNSPSAVKAEAARRSYDWGVSLASTNPELAIEKFKQAITLDPGNGRAHYSLGMAYNKLTRYKEAAESFKRAAHLSPDWAEAHLRLGQMYYVLDKESQALDEHKRLLKLNPLMADTLLRAIKNDGKVTAPARAANDVAVNRLPSSLKSNDDRKKEERPSSLTQASIPGGGTRLVPESKVIATALPATAVGPVREANAGNAKPDQDQTTIYRVGVDDVLDIRLLNSPTNRSSLYTVLDRGLIEFPLAGVPMSVAGLTTEEIQSRIEAELKRRGFQNTQLSVGVRDYTSHQVNVTGLVGMPGNKRLRREAVPLYVVLAEAQPRPEAGRATITRMGKPALVVDLTDPSGMNLLVWPGDLIVLGARPLEFYYIGGRVNLPGQKSYQPGVTLLQAILAAGGFTSSNNDAAEISREGLDHRLSTTKYYLREIKAGKVPDPQLQPGDRVEVIK